MEQLYRNISIDTESTWPISSSSRSTPSTAATSAPGSMECQEDVAKIQPDRMSLNEGSGSNPKF